jgi:hypothetical protein
MDQELKRLMEELGGAITESLTHSEPIAEAIAHIKASGYDIFLVLNATIDLMHGQEQLRQAARRHGQLEATFNSQDIKFLKSLHISVK